MKTISARFSRHLAHSVLVMCLALLAGGVRASTTISANGTFTIDNSNTTRVGTTTTWNDTGTLTINSGATLQTWPLQNHTVANNNAIVFTGTGGTITLRFNGNDTDFKMNGSSITSTATGAQTLDILTGYSGNGDRESVTFNSGIPNATGGSPLGLNITFRTQTGSTSWVNLNAANTFTGPITLVAGSGPATGTLTIGGTLTQFNGNTNGSGTLGGGNYPGAISLGTSTILNYASSAAQTLSGIISGSGTLQTTGSGALTLSGLNTYSGNTTVNSGGTLTLGSTGGLKFVVTNASNNRVTGGGAATLNGTFTVDTSAVTVTSGSWTLVNATTKTFGGTFGLAGFTGPVSNVFTKVTGGQVWTFSTATGVLSLTSKAIITSFGIPGSAGVINNVGTKSIALTVPYGTSLATLAPTFTLTSGLCNQTSGAPPSPSFASANPVHYIVTDGAVVNDYTVTVTVAPASSGKTMLTCDFGALGLAVISGNTATLTVPPSQSLNPLSPTFTISPNATISPASGSPQNFTTPVAYRITAQDGSFQDYTVTVQTYASWTYSGSLFILTTPEGANVPAGASETNFPLLVRLNSSNFNFAQAQSDGRDIRFTNLAGAALSYQIEQWDAAGGTASIWVKIPTITGNARQEIRMYWGKAGVASESNGAAVFNAANGYAAVLHMNETVQDVVGSVTPSDTGTTLATGMIGKGRKFGGGVGIHCGDTITNFAQGNTAHSTQAWFRATAVNCEIVDWGVEGGGFNKVQIRLISPPRMYVDGNFASVTGTTTLDTTQWHHVVHTYTPGSPNVARIYVDGQLDGSANVTMNLPNPSRMWIGGWYGSYSYAGDIDEVRVSKVARSANWIKMEYENQKPLQTLVGTLVQAGSTFSASPSAVTMNEGTSATLTAQAGGAQKVYWIRKQNGTDTLLAVDQFSLNLIAGRVTGNQSFVIQFMGVYPTGIQTVDIPVTVIEDLPDPIFTLTGPTTWDGRQTIAVVANVSNLSTLQAKGVANLSYKWTVSGVAVTKQITPGTLTLLRAQGNGPMTVTLVMDNGGSPVTVTKVIDVQQPQSDPWVQRTPDANEKPVNNQFFARDDTGLGKIFYKGTQSGTPDTVFLKVYTTDTGADVLYATHRQALSGGAYSFTAPIAAGKVTYKVVYGTTTGGVDTPVGSPVTNLVCGDAYIIEGQSNALATDNSEPSDPTVFPWIRSYGKTVGWGYAINKGSELELGVWGMILAKRMSNYANMPICIINGAVGGTRIDQHRPNPADNSAAGSLYSIYANLYNRVVGAKLTHGIRAVLWHQGEQDQGSGGPDGDYDYKFYQQYFVDISGAWKQDFPNIRNYYVFQIWPGACGDTTRNDQLREVQRTLPYLYSNMKPMSTLGIIPGSGCHYVLAGYQVFSDLLGPLMEQDVYGRNPAEVHTAPDLKRAYFTNGTRNKIALEFSQGMIWNTGAPGLFYLSGEAVPATVSSGSVSGNVIELQLNKTSDATTISYVKGLNSWSQSNILRGTNGIAALTFADVPIGPPVPTGLSATAGDRQVALSWTASAGATGYKLKRSTTSGGPYTVIGTPTGITYTDTTVTNGTTYYYVVSATSGLGESVDSAQVSATPSAPLSSAKDILTFVFPGLPATTISGTSISVTAPYGTPVTNLYPTYTISPLASCVPLSPPAAPGLDFTNARTYTVTAQNLTTKVYTVTVTMAPSPYSLWASAPAQGLTAGVNDGPLDDPERDGIFNLLEFILNGAPMVASPVVLPKLTRQPGGDWVFEYDRSVASVSSTTQVVEYGSELVGWIAIPVSAGGGGPVTITPGGTTDHVRVMLPAAVGKQFVRLKVTKQP